MVLDILVKKQVNVKYLQVDAGVRYWDDGEINGKPDDQENPKMPFIVEGRWKPLINIDTGMVENWEKGIAASIHYKVCDDGIYTLIDDSGNVVKQRKYDYVPMYIGNDDYIILNIDKNGLIDGFFRDFSDF